MVIGLYALGLWIVYWSLVEWFSGWVVRLAEGTGGLLEEFSIGIKGTDEDWFGWRMDESLLWSFLM